VTIFLNHYVGVQVDTVLKINTGADNEELVRVTRVNNSANLAGVLFYNHNVNEPVVIFAFGGNSADCDTSDYCPSNISNVTQSLDTAQLLSCWDRQQAAYSSYELKRNKLPAMLELRDIYCDRWRWNSSDSLWPNYGQCAMTSNYSTIYGTNHIWQFYEDMSVFYGNLEEQLRQARERCETGTRNYDQGAAEASAALAYWQGIQYECSRYQVDVENQACDAKDNVGQCWIGYETCYWNARSNFIPVYDAAVNTSYRQMDEMRAVLRIECLIQALNYTGQESTTNQPVLGQTTVDNNTDLDARLTACINTFYTNASEVTSLRVDNYSIPCQGSCPGSFPYTPGTTTFANLFYASHQSLAQGCSARCCEGNASTPTTQAIFVLGNYSTNSCPAGTVQITDSSECQSASTFLASHLNTTVHPVTWQGDETVPDWPTHCHQVIALGAPGVWFNNHSTGRTRPSARPICKDMYLPGPTVSSAAGSLLCNAATGTLEEAKAACDQLSDCEVLLDAACDNADWLYCETNLSAIIANNAATDACTKVKISR